LKERKASGVDDTLAELLQKVEEKIECKLFETNEEKYGNDYITEYVRT